MKLYLSGPMNRKPGPKGLPDLAPFLNARDKLEAVGYETARAIAPWYLLGAVPEENHDTELWKQVELPNILSCDGIALLPGWKERRGCHLELGVAMGSGKPAAELGIWLRVKRVQGLVNLPVVYKCPNCKFKYPNVQDVNCPLEPCPKCGRKARIGEPLMEGEEDNYK